MIGMGIIEQYLNFPYLDSVYYGNTLGEYIYAAIFFVVLLIVFRLARTVITIRLQVLSKKTSTNIDDMIISIVEVLTIPFLSFLSIYFALKTLSVNELLDRAIEIILILWVVYEVVQAVQVIINYAVVRFAADGDELGTRAATSLLGTFAKVILWSLGLLFVLSNLGVNVNSLIAGLGVGGIAIAFALQNILVDLFSSFSIYFDKPFRVGDFIVVGDTSGVVEKIGIKTTRIRALQGEEIVVSNTNLTTATVQNFKKMTERRVVVALGATYDTPNEKLQKIPGLIQTVVESVSGTRFDRAHFKTFAPSSLDFEVVYHVTSDEYGVYMDANQEINLKIKEIFEKEKIDFAFPTQTLYIEK